MTISPRRIVSPWLVLVIVGLAQFMVVLDATVVNVALPSIQRGLGFSADSLQWVINAYTLSFGGFLLLGGRAADLFGRKRLFIAGVVLFSAASLLNGLSTSAGMLVIGRALQGLGGALVSPAALSVLTTSFADGAERTKALGVWSAVAVGGGAAGLLLGGILTQVLSWQWVFFVNVPVGIGTLLLALWYVPESRAAGIGRGIDIGGAVSITAGLMLLVYSIVNAQRAGWVSMQTIGLGAVGLALIATFVVLELRLRYPLIRLGIFRMRSLTSANTIMLLVAAGLFAMFFFATLYVQQILGFSPLVAGLAFLPVTAGIIAGAGLSQQGIKRFGVRAVAVFGIVLASVGLILLSRIPVAGSYAADLIPGLMLMSVGMGFTFVPVTLMATTNVAAGDAGLASGLINTAQQLGGALGLAILSTFAANTTASTLASFSGVPTGSEHVLAVVSGFRVGFFVGACLMLAGAVVLAVFVRRRDVASIEAGAQPAEAEVVVAA